MNSIAKKTKTNMRTLDYAVTLNPQNKSKNKTIHDFNFDGIVKEISNPNPDKRTTPDYYSIYDKTVKATRAKKAKGLLNNKVTLSALMLSVGFIIGAIIFGLMTKDMLLEAKHINQDLKAQITTLQTDLNNKEIAITTLNQSNSTLQATLTESQTVQAELQGRLDKIARYEKLLMSGNIEKIKTENMTETQKTFVSKMIPAVLKTYADTGVKPSVSLAQAGVESGWGNSKLASSGKNLYGMKAGSKWTGAVYSSATKEHGGDGFYTISAKFRAYGSWEDSVRDYAKTMTGGRYDKAMKATNYRDTVVAIKNAGYASDPNYVKHITGTIEKYNFQALDVI